MKSLQFSLDFRSGAPIYVQIVEQVQSFLASGELKPGDQLPTVRQLAAELRINFNTIARAYRMLDEAGLISTQQGRGTYLLEQPDESVMQKLKEESLEIQCRRFLRSMDQQGFTADETKAFLERLINRWKAGSLAEDVESDNQEKRTNENQERI